MTERSYQNAVQLLQQRLGAQWDGLETDGRDEMARVLKRELGYDDQTAREALDAMIASGQLRYQRGDAAGGTREVSDDSPQIIAMSPNATSSAPGAGFEASQGHWEIGSQTDAGWEGRAGQVMPR